MKAHYVNLFSTVGENPLCWDGTLLTNVSTFQPWAEPGFYIGRIEGSKIVFYGDKELKTNILNHRLKYYNNLDL